MFCQETDTDKIDYYNEQIDSYGREHLLRQMRPTLHYMDFLQASFRCCGNTEPRDWMKNPAGAKFTVPDSCCTFETRMKDCGKGAITPNSVIPAHIYNQGCFMKAKEFASLVTTLLIVMLVLELIIGLAWVRGKESPFAPAPSPEEMARRRFTAMMGGSPDDPSELLELQSRGGFGARTLGHSAVTSYYPEDSATSMVPSPRTTPLLGRTLGDRLKYSRFGQFMNTFNTGVSFPNPLV
ncbi:unnamed protein product [Cyprideis torosa]|uniref:Uncharacterized protein n=1 Tax=Cyprideis torosa TaxID=163714 RepID=A0A7R8WMU8_9CRUS|nr:unnamed protein product [Cyprideis torosa]CAG0905588.1 unnamed protein product [Cyprideis torosa]